MDRRVLNKHRIAALFLAVVLMLLTLFACGEDTLSDLISSGDIISDSGLFPSRDKSSDSDSEDEVETYEITVYVEGFKETVLLTQYQGDGWSIGYDTDKMKIYSSEQLGRILSEDVISDTDAQWSGRYKDMIRFASVYNTGDSTDVYLDVQKFSGTSSGRVMHSDFQALDCEQWRIYTENVNEKNALVLYACAGKEWDSDVYVIYYIDTPDGCFRIITHYFLEASNGWGSRFPAIVNTFELQ